MQLTLSQRAALDVLVAEVEQGAPLASLSGAAGTGKTTVIRELFDELDARGLDVAVCTPTNKAAQVLNAKGIDATTFFKRFYILEEAPKPGHKPRFQSCQTFLAQHPEVIKRGGRWREHEDLLPKGKQTWVDVLIIDEASMVTHRMCREMLRMCKTLILVGDHNQLPPVNDPEHPAGFFSTMRHTAELTEIMRQAEGSLILTLANEIRSKGPRVEKLIDLMQPSEDDSFAELVQAGAQVIAWSNNERRRVNAACRRLLGFTEPTPMPGDRMVVTNNYSEDLINGTFVEVVSFEWDRVNPHGIVRIRLEDGTTNTCSMNMSAFIADQQPAVQEGLLQHIKFPPEGDGVTRLDLAFAYCITAHKAQGSEWERVVVIDQRQNIRKIQKNNPQAGMHPDEYVRRWIYTAITRARRQLVIAQRWFAQSYEQVI